MKSVFVLMSGGVDSSTAALLLKLSKEFDIIGVHLQCFGYCNPRDEEDARRVAQLLNIPFYVFEFTSEFEDKVIDYFVRSYQSGLTPNPDVKCNEFIKFGCFFEKAKSLGGDFIASGHYAKIKKLKEKFYLCQPKDLDKDQTYFLWSLKREILSQIIFPLGEYLKKEVRQIAKNYNLPVAEKKESMGICFIGTVKLREFLKKYLIPQKGKIIDINGNILGEHDGYFFYTEGQRHGLNIKSGKGPFYVVGKIKEENLVVVAPAGHPALYTKKIYLNEVNILAEELLPKKKNKVLVRCRHRQKLSESIYNRDENSIEFLSPQPMIAPGQSAVFYSKDGFVLGGGVIFKKFPEIISFLKI